MNAAVAVSRRTRIAHWLCSRFLSSIAILAMLLAGVVPALAQADRGTIEGLVADQTGAVVPDALVQVVQVETNATLEFTTNNEGLYTAPNLPMGTYRILVKKQGFSTVVREPIDVRPSVKVRVDLALTPGAIEQQITVTTEAPLIDVSATSNTAGLGQKLIDDLPIIVSTYQRAITDMLNNLPGSTNSGSFTVKLNGGATGDTEVYIDGGPASEWGIARGGLSEVSPMIDQVGEFSMVSNGFNAEYGGFGNTFVNVTIKSGTNVLHGSVFNHLGNSALNAKSYFAKEVTPFRQNEGGFTIGGPVVIPGLYNGKDKTFFFGSLGMFFARQGASGDLVTVPTARMRNGDFSEIGVRIYDPLTNEPFENNQIPLNRISPAAQRIIGYVPLPENGDRINNYHSKAAPQWPYLNSFTPLFKIDHNFSTSQHVSVTYQKGIKHRELWTNGLGPYPTWGSEQTNPLDQNSDQIANNWKLRVNHDYIISPTVINHVTFSMDRYVNRGANKTFGQGWSDTLGLTGIPADDGSFPQITFSGGTIPSQQYGRSYDENWKEMRFNINEGLTWLHGKHSMKFGFEIGLNHEDRLNGGTAGSYTFAASTTAAPGDVDARASGNAFASFLLGEVNQVSARIPLLTRLRYNKYGIYAQDEWRIRNNLTLSYGLRWDYMPPFSEVDNLSTSFQPDLLNPATGTLGALGLAKDRDFQDPWRKGFGPRLGLAYQFDPKTMIRVSSGIVYASSGNVVPFLTTGAEGYAAYPSFTANGQAPLYNWDSATFPSNFNRPTATPDPSFLNGQSINYIRRDAARLPQIVNWSLVVQRELTPNLALEVSYQGNRSTHLALGSGASQINYVDKKWNFLGNTILGEGLPPAFFLPYDFAVTFPQIAALNIPKPYPTFNGTLGQALRPYPQYNQISSDVALLPEGKASYHSLQAKATQRYSHGLSGLFYFTWMKSITNAIGGSTTYANFIEGSLQYPGENPTTIDPNTPKFVFGANYSYDLPVGRGKHFLSSMPRVVDYVLGGWTVAGSLRYQSGTPLQINSFSLASAVLGYTNLFPSVYGNYLGGSPYLNKEISDPSEQLYLNPAAFKMADAWTFGNLSRYNSWITGPWIKSEGLSLRKVIPITERTKLEVGADAINPFNITRWGNPNTTLGDANFGRITTTQGSGARQVQLNMKLAF